MELIIENRVKQALRYLKPATSQKVYVALSELENSETIADIKNLPLIRKVILKSEQVFVYRVTKKLRILFKDNGDQTLLIEDIVSSDVIAKFFKGRY